MIPVKIMNHQTNEGLDKGVGGLTLHLLLCLDWERAQCLKNSDLIMKKR